MDLDYIQKVNKLAIELMNKGVVADRDEAVRQAESMLGGSTDGTKIHKLTEGEHPMREAPKEEPKAAPAPEAAPAVSSKAMDELKAAMKSNTEFIVKQFREYSTKIAALEQEVVALKKKLAQSRPPASAPKQETLRQQADAKPKSQTEGRLRSGDFTPEQVSINEMFYMGNKKF